jgi:hypothetical protein
MDDFLVARNQALEQLDAAMAEVEAPVLASATH